MAWSHRRSQVPRRSRVAAVVAALRLIPMAGLLAALASAIASLALAQPAGDKNPCGSLPLAPFPNAIAAGNAAAAGGSTPPQSPPPAPGTAPREVGAGDRAHLAGKDVPSLIDGRRLRLEDRIVDGPVYLSDVDLDTLTIRNSVINNGFCIANSTIDKRILIAGTQFRKTRDENRNSLELTQVKFGNFRMTDDDASAALDINMSQVTGDAAFIRGVNAKSLGLFDAQFSDIFVFTGGKIDDARVWSVSLGSFVLLPTDRLNDLHIGRLSSRSSLILPIGRELGPRRTLELSEISCPMLQLAGQPGGAADPRFNPEDRPKSTSILDVRCARIDVGEHPDKFLDFLQGGRDGTAFRHDRNFFGQLAKSYLEGAYYPSGRQLYVRQKEVDAEQESAVARGAMKTMGVVEFGTNLTKAVGIVAGFVLVGWGLFSYGSRLDRRDWETSARAHDNRPNPNWLWFSIDSAIPFLSLNDDHKKVSFGRWWCQGYLYMMKILSPIFVFFAFQFLRQLLPS